MRDEDQSNSSCPRTVSLVPARRFMLTSFALYRARNRTSTSEELYTKLHSAYSQHRWTSIESQLLLQCMNLQRKLQKPRERLLSTLALLRAGLVVGSLKWTLGNDVHGQDDEKIARDMMAEAKELSKDLEKDFAVFAFPLFVMTLASKQGRFVEQEDGVMVDIAIESYLPSVRAKRYRLPRYWSLADTAKL